MNKSYLEIETPKSCYDCKVSGLSMDAYGDENYYCRLIEKYVIEPRQKGYTDSRHPDCPLLTDDRKPRCLETVLELVTIAIGDWTDVKKSSCPFYIQSLKEAKEEIQRLIDISPLQPEENN